MACICNTSQDRKCPVHDQPPLPAHLIWNEHTVPGWKPACGVCGVAFAQHGTYPTCATHPYTADGKCQHVGVLTGSVFVGAACPGAECKNGCVAARGVDVPLAPSSTEAMRLALAALEKSVDNFQANVQHRQAIVALRAALADGVKGGQGG